MAACRIADVDPVAESEVALRLRLVTGNTHKFAEMSATAAMRGLHLVHVPLEVAEMQSADMEEIVRDKTLKAFSRVGRPLLVEHTGLFLDGLNGLPGGLCRLFWDRLGADGLAALFARDGVSREASAVTGLGYCDGLRIRLFFGEQRGRISGPAGDHGFHWDCMFVPEGEKRTWAEMAGKGAASMRGAALGKLLDHLAIRRAP